MNRVVLFSICTAVALLGGACHRNANPEQGKSANIIDLATHPVPAGAAGAVTITGCLTASGDRFVLTQLDEKSSENHTYQLVNADAQLRNLVGQRVQVIGDAAQAQKAEAREVTPAPAATSGSSNAKVSTVEDTKVDANTLRVTSVMPVGGSSCTH